MDSDSFESNKNQIISVLRSIRIPFNNPFKDNDKDLTGDIITYTNPKFNFSVSYPQKWSIKTSEDNNLWQGIIIYPHSESNNSLSVLYNSAERKKLFLCNNFTTSSGMKGCLYSRQSNNEIWVDLEIADDSNYDGNLHLSLRMDLATFRRFEEQIMGVFRSLVLIDR